MARRAAVEDAWRRRADSSAVERTADRLAARWRDKNRVLPLAGQPGWQPEDEGHLLHGLDRLLAVCHPDVGRADPAALPREVALELRRRYLRDGWWYRDDQLLLLPRRRGPRGLRRPFPAAPLEHVCAVMGEAAGTVEIVRVALGDDPDLPTDPPLCAADCMVAPMFGADALSLAFAKDPGGRWTYGPHLEDAAVDDALLVRVVAAAENAGAAILALPEYACSPKLRERWLELLASRPPSTLRWLLLGSGPTDGSGDDNVATLVSADAAFRVDQPKVRLFDLRPQALAEWGCPGVPPEADPEAVAERARVHRGWSLIECNRGRIAVAVCESLKPEADDTTVSGLGRAAPTLVLCPVFSKPTNQSLWERPASEYWGELGTEVVIANSLVVAQWRAAATGVELGHSVACAAVRRLDDSPKSHHWEDRWEIEVVDGSLPGGVTDRTVQLRAPNGLGP